VEDLLALGKSTELDETEIETIRELLGIPEWALAIGRTSKYTFRQSSTSGSGRRDPSIEPVAYKAVHEWHM
jgi:hypothetical protein